MTSEQLQNARAERWRQVSNAVLTAEDARAWLDRIGFCLYLPKHTSGLAFAPAPSFVEAVAGVPSEAPGREAVENATALLHRLAGDGAIVPLSLLGANHYGGAGAGATDTPDFLVTREALPYVFSLIGGRNWKSGPGGNASPLMVEIWTLLNDGHARTAQEIQTALGRELTETAVLHALVELWKGLRAIPVYDGEAAVGTAGRWELTQARFAAEMTASQKVAQVTALSALVSLYLESVVAASSDEIETFLSPLAGRSRVREVVNGLSATRQLELVSVGAQPLFHVTGSLPEFAEPAREESRVEESREVAPKRFERREPRAGEARATGEKRADRPGGFKKRDRFGERPSFEGRPRFEKRTEGFERRPPGKKPFEKPAKRFGGQTSEGERSREGGERRASGGGGKFPPKRFSKTGERKPWQERGERRPFEKPTGRGGEGEFNPRRDERGERGDRRSFERPTGRSGEGEFRPGRDERRDRGDRRSFSSGKFERREPRGKRPFSGERGTAGERGAAGERRRDSRSGSDFRSGTGSRQGGWKPKGERAGFPKQGKPEFRKAGEREFEGPREHGDAGFRREGRPQFKSGTKPGFGKKKFGEGGAGKPGFTGGGKPRFKSGGKAGFKKAGFGKSPKPFGKPGTGSAKPFGKSVKPFRKSGKAFGKPGFGKAKPGGFKPPFKKRKSDEGGNGE